MRTRVLALLIALLTIAAEIPARAEPPSSEPVFLLAELSEEEQQKRDLFLRARENVVPLPASTPTSPPSQSPAPARTPERSTPVATPRPPVARPTPAATPHPTVRQATTPVRTAPAATPRATPTPRPTAALRPTRTPRATPTPRPTRTPKATPTPRPTRTPKATPTPRSRQPAEVIIEKSGRQERAGLQPPPGRVRPPNRRWRYLNDSIRRAIDKAPVQRGRWKYIIIHNSATRQGNAKIFDNYHRRVRKMSNGLAYHFVIGNGTSSGNGEIEIGSRWTRQINGGHVASDYLNNIALGICLVGDFDRDVPTQAQLDSLRELITYLRARVGRNGREWAQVRGHREINPKPTSCPGKRFPTTKFRREFP